MEVKGQYAVVQFPPDTPGSLPSVEVVLSAWLKTYTQTKQVVCKWPKNYQRAMSRMEHDGDDWQTFPCSIKKMNFMTLKEARQYCDVLEEFSDSDAYERDQISKQEMRKHPIKKINQFKNYNQDWQATLGEKGN